MADDFTPTELPLDAQEGALTDKVRSLEADRLGLGIECDALAALEGRNDTENGELAGLIRGVERVDRRLEFHRAALERVRAEKAAANPPAGIAAS